MKKIAQFILYTFCLVCFTIVSCKDDEVKDPIKTKADDSDGDGVKDSEDKDPKCLHM